MFSLKNNSIERVTFQKGITQKELLSFSVSLTKQNKNAVIELLSLKLPHISIDFILRKEKSRQEGLTELTRIFLSLDGNGYLEFSRKKETLPYLITILLKPRGDAIQEHKEREILDKLLSHLIDKDVSVRLQIAKDIMVLSELAVKFEKYYYLEPIVLKFLTCVLQEADEMPLSSFKIASINSVAY